MARFIVVCDVDSTLIENEVIDLLAEVAGTSKEVSAITAKAMRGDLDFTESLIKRVDTLRGTPATALNTVLEQVTVTQGALALAQSVHEAGGFMIAVSGGFHEVIDPIATQRGVDAWTANRLEILDGVFTGRLYGPIIDAAAKANYLSAFAKSKRIPLTHTIAVGDGANDLAMMSMAGLSVAFCAKPVVRDAASVHIDERDLSLVASYFGRSAM